MMKTIVIYTVLLSFLVSCTSIRKPTDDTDTVEDSLTLIVNEENGYQYLKEESDIDGVDSIMTIISNGTGIYKIALGGNIEVLADMTIKTDSEDIQVYTLADYFQNDQIFYILHDPGNSVTYQSARLNLPTIGIGIRDYNLIDSIIFKGDSLLLMSRKRPEISTYLQLDTLQCDSNKIINYYEFE